MKPNEKIPQQDIEQYYNDFCRRFEDDYVFGNGRVVRQLEFFSRAIPPESAHILVVGCGMGQAPHFLATKVAKRAKILAIDISAKIVQMADVLYPHRNVEYRRANIVSDLIEGTWDAIVLPDVYEHIPVTSRTALHAKLNELLSVNGRIFLTVPSPQYQAFLRSTGGQLQIVDEDVSLHDLSRLASDVHGGITYYNMVSLAHRNDYFHAVVERESDQIETVCRADKIPIKGWPQRSLFQRGWRYVWWRLGLSRMKCFWRRIRFQRKVAHVLKK